MGSARAFARRTRDGGPCAISMAADEGVLAGPSRGGFIRDAGDPRARGRGVVTVLPGSGRGPDGLAGSLRQARGEGRITFLAVPNPDHARCGMRAKAAPGRTPLRDRTRPFLVPGENVPRATHRAPRARPSAA